MKQNLVKSFEAIYGALIAIYFVLKILERIFYPKTFSGWLSNTGRDLGAWIVVSFVLAGIVCLIGQWLGLDLK